MPNMSAASTSSSTSRILKGRYMSVLPDCVRITMPLPHSFECQMNPTRGRTLFSAEAFSPRPFYPCWVQGIVGHGPCGDRKNTGPSYTLRGSDDGLDRPALPVLP